MLLLANPHWGDLHFFLTPANKTFKSLAQFLASYFSFCESNHLTGYWAAHQLCAQDSNVQSCVQTEQRGEGHEGIGFIVTWAHTVWKFYHPPSSLSFSVLLEQLKTRVSIMLTEFIYFLFFVVYKPDNTIPFCLTQMVWRKDKMVGTGVG